MDAALAIRAVNLGKRFLCRGWEPRRGMHQLAEQTLRAPFRLARRWSGVSPAATADPYFWALHGVSFEIPRGQLIGLIGPNRAGKSVLLKVLARVTQPSDGFAEVRGAMAAVLEGGAPFQSELTGRENLTLNGIVFGMDRHEVEAKLEAMVAFAGIGPFLDTPVKHYSSGMVARLALAMTIHLGRDLLLIDETLATGDEAFREKCVRTLRALTADGRTVLLVSHEPALISQTCQRCLCLEAGQLVDDGPTSEVLSRYASRARAHEKAVTFTPTANSSLV